MHLFCFGHGYVAKYIKEGLPKHYKFSASHTGKRENRENEYIFNDSMCFDKSVLKDVTHILISIPPNEQGDPVYLKYSDYINSLSSLQWLGYFSSTSVYGDHQGKWVNEESIKAPGILGANRLKAEYQWLNSGILTNIFRLSAIYGPGRSVLNSIIDNKAKRIIKEGHAFSRIYVTDIVNIILKMLNFSGSGIYNLSDDHPAPSHKVIEYGCKLLKRELPPKIEYSDAELSPVLRNYYLENKKIENTKIKNILNYDFKFPSYKEGLKDIMKCIDY
jgi:hypothetical protein